MDRLTGMQVFVKAVESGSFSAAGEAMQMSSESMSRNSNSISAFNCSTAPPAAKA